MRIGDLAHRAGVSRRLLRYYEDQGLLHPARTPNGYRRYTEADAAAVRHIRLLLAAGLSTTVIARIIACVHDEGGAMVLSPCRGMTDHLGRERARIAASIARLTAAEQALDAMLDTLPRPPAATRPA